jgi:hypothetical protein
MLKLGAAVLTADRIDFWIRRHVIQYCCETPIANSPENFAVNTASRIARRTRARAIFIGMYCLSLTLAVLSFLVLIGSLRSSLDSNAAPRAPVGIPSTTPLTITTT